MKRIAALLLSLCVLAAALTAAASRAQNGTDVSGFISETVDGNAIDGSCFGAHGASVVMLWATWSFPSLNQLALMQQVHETHPEYGVYGLLLTDATSTPEAALAYMQSHGVTFPVFVMDEVWSSVVEQSAFIPQTYIVDSSGVIVETWLAELTSAEIILSLLSAWAPMTADGDVNLDGEVTAEDALIALRISMDMMECTGEMLSHGDIDSSGAIEASDALSILRIALGLV